ncbi:mannose-6-phosphate isomerase, class I [Bacillus sp. DX3.1]|uniref:mannose-6-phosphate isomerase, class I n=1 Tax=Bacillus sp. DX3.1 TaxID=3052091 RepID=UPI002570B9C2|nr:mannose-6-phosphate isomerase, class I [Bacillus sp. DX3.1]WJE82088.1 mannose-6-phosphate isomerase, class I [Bacillus sp. DX3.1]
MKEPIFLTPVFKERIWGGTTLHNKFEYQIPSDHTGECWAISAHQNGQSVVREGKYKGMKLEDLYKKHPSLFGNPQSEVFPLLTKILDANKDLSVQVHPDDAYANVYENGELGKTECWYIIDCKDDAEIIFGHNATTKEEFVRMVEEKDWNKLLRREKIQPGDFFYVPSGTIHALCEGTLVLETQQSSDTTYRVYDYDRVDEDGNTRELHLQKAIDVTMVPHKKIISNPKIEKFQGATVTTFVEETYFSVYKWDVRGEVKLRQDKNYLLLSVVDGEAELFKDDKSYFLSKGENFILPSDFGEFEIKGNITIIVSNSNQ